MLLMVEKEIWRGITQSLNRQLILADKNKNCHNWNIAMQKSCHQMALSGLKILLNSMKIS